MASPALKARLAAQDPDPLAVALYRIMRLTVLPPPLAGEALAPLTIPRPPASQSWAAVTETAVQTVRPGCR